MRPDQELVDIVAAQETALVFPSFDASSAWELGAALRNAFLASAAYTEKQLGVVIAIELFSGLTLFRAVVGDGGVTPDNWYANESTRCVQQLAHSAKGDGLTERQQSSDASANHRWALDEQWHSRGAR
jgi:uncharacterized protein (UPF0303 family)